jgi:hypothetical protein
VNPTAVERRVPANRKTYTSGEFTTLDHIALGRSLNLSSGAIQVRHPDELAHAILQLIAC